MIKELLIKDIEESIEHIRKSKDVLFLSQEVNEMKQNTYASEAVYQAISYLNIVQSLLNNAKRTAE